MTMSTRVAVMDQGRALQVAPPRELFARPADITVATFIGTPAMNIIPATVVANNAGLTVELLGRQIPIGPRHHSLLEGLKRIHVGVRPQAVRLVSPEFDRVPGRVFLREPLGLEDEVLVETIDGTRVKVVTAGGEGFPEGAVVGLELEASKLYLFHPDSGVVLLSGIT
jgi:ABC-type sugar transport system ATPase subunit